MALVDNYWQYLRALFAQHQGSRDSGGAIVDLDESIKRGYRRAYKWQKDAADVAAADATSSTFFAYLPTRCRIAGTFIVPSDALVAHDANFADIVVADGGVNPVAWVDTTTLVAGGSGDWVAGVALAMDCYQDALAGGTTLDVGIGKDGLGVIVPACAIIVITEEV
jgi:hypothetical protein